MQIPGRSGGGQRDGNTVEDGVGGDLLGARRIGEVVHRDPGHLDRIPHPFILTRNALLLAQLLLILCDIRQGPAELRA